MASFLPYLLTVICGLEMLLILGTPLSTVADGTVVDNCTAIQQNFTWMIKPNDTTTILTACTACVIIQTNLCGFREDATIPTERFKCTKNVSVEQFTKEVVTSVVDCNKKYGPTITTSTTPAPNVTTTTTTTTTTISPNVTTSTTTEKPSNVTTSTTTVTPTKPTGPTTTPTTVRPTPAPSGGGFSFANFLGGIIFTLAVSSLAYVAWRFYRARNPNYHTF